MSVYSTPIKTCFDEGFSPSSNHSFYFTPRETITYFTPQSKSRKRKIRYHGKVPRFNVYNEELSRSEENLRNNCILSSSPISVKDYASWGYQNSQAPVKETVISFGKENIGVQFSSTPSLLRCGEKKANPTPLKNISNSVVNEKGGTVFEARISSIGKQHFDLRITTEADVEPTSQCRTAQYNTAARSSDKETLSAQEKNENRKPTDESNGILLNTFGVGSKVSRKPNKIVNSKSAEKCKIMVDVPTQTEGDISVDFVCKESKENMDIPAIDHVENDRNELIEVNKITVETNDSQTSLLIEKSPVEKRLRVWPFLKVSRLRISPVKRLFSKSSKYLLLLKQKLRKLSVRPFKPLLETKNDEDCCPSAALSVSEIQTQSHHSVCTVCLGKLTDKEEMMSKALSTLMLKLSTMENELKEIKGLLKNNAVNISHPIRNTLPPPPPPPPPPNFLNQSTGTLKRKADLTTPENDNHAIKRPAIKNEKTHFAITVEDIRSVKLRKTPANALRRESKINGNAEDVLRSVKMKKNKKNNSGGKKRTQNLAELCSRENVSINRNSIVDSNTLCTPRRENHSSPVIYEETPVTSKSTLISSRSQKRKELLIESPIRKRINTGNNTTIYSDNELE